MDGFVPIRLRPHVFPVEIGNIMALWPKWEPLLKRALRSDETIDALGVRQRVLDGKAHLWVQWSTALEGFIVTEFAEYDKGTWLRLWLAATAPGAILDDDAFEDVLAAWRDAHGCRGFEVIGRLGWAKRFPEARFVGVVLRTTT